MVLRPKARESRSPPGLAGIRTQKTEIRNQNRSGRPHQSRTPSPSWLLAFCQSGFCHRIAGWSSPVARQAHNLKVRGSNPLPATKSPHIISRLPYRPANEPGDRLSMSGGCPKNPRPRVSETVSENYGIGGDPCSAAGLVVTEVVDQRGIHETHRMGFRGRRDCVPCRRYPIRQARTKLHEQRLSCCHTRLLAPNPALSG